MIVVTDKDGPLSFADISLNSRNFSMGIDGILKYPRQLIDTLYISFISKYRGPIVVDNEKIRNIDTLRIDLEPDLNGKLHFRNEKWLIKGTKLFHTLDSSGNFDRNKYFDRVMLKDLKYREE